eukprot:maker-scaffold74_size411160-snap-gene-3.21 protein:Tk04230 transcript:maker-scaffold74_size411160-snap-gene-3.21-mRNA-1 annotation:"sugar phosphate exchanger 3-like"
MKAFIGRIQSANKLCATSMLQELNRAQMGNLALSEILSTSPPQHSKYLRSTQSTAIPLPPRTNGGLDLRSMSNLGWNRQFASLVADLNRRMGLVKRLLHWIPRSQMKPVIEGLIMSKLRYGLPIFGQIRLTDQDCQTGNMKQVQVFLNKLMRLLAHKCLIDKIGPSWVKGWMMPILGEDRQGPETLTKYV